MEAAHGHVLADYHQVGRGVAATDHRQHVRVREDSQLGILLVKVPGYSGSALSQGQDLSSDLIALPLPPPGLATRTANTIAIDRKIIAYEGQ